jgi:hypothetical protein
LWPRDWMDATVAYGAFPVIEPSEVVALHADVYERLRELVNITDKKAITVPLDGMKTHLYRETNPGEKPAVFRLSHGGPLRTMLWNQAAWLIAGTDRLLACRYCGEPFLALRKSVFCTPKCAQRWHDREKVKAKQKGVGR